MIQCTTNMKLLHDSKAYQQKIEMRGRKSQTQQNNGNSTRSRRNSKSGNNNSRPSTSYNLALIDNYGQRFFGKLKAKGCSLENVRDMITSKLSIPHT